MDTQGGREEEVGQGAGSVNGDSEPAYLQLVMDHGLLPAPLGHDYHRDPDAC